MQTINVNMNSLNIKYQQEIKPILVKEFGLKNSMAVPKIVKIIVNVGIGDVTHEKQARQKAKDTLTAITGQIPLARQTNKAIAEFKTRRGDIVGLKVTLRGQRMFQFLQKLISIVLPRVRDFQGVKRTAFDKNGNYTLGLREQIIFPEVDYDKIDKVRGLEISIVTSTKDKKQALRLLELLGIPFEKINPSAGGKNKK